MFGNVEAGGRLDPGDADLVDAIHTCGGSLGFPNPYTHVDFYPNGGIAPQPGCANDFVGELLPGILDHDCLGLTCFSLHPMSRKRCVCSYEERHRTQLPVRKTVTRSLVAK
jgi:hypothetical protein